MWIQEIIRCVCYNEWILYIPVYKMEVPDIVFQTFLVNHPYYTKDICDINKQNSQICRSRNLLNSLIKKWLFPQFSYADIQKYYSKLTLNDIIEYSLYFSPIPESIGKYNPLSLYFQAGKTLVEQECKIFVTHIYNNYLSYNSPEHYILVTALIAFRYEHYSLLNYLYNLLKVVYSTESNYQVIIEFIRRKLCLFVACVIGDEILIDEASTLLKNLTIRKHIITTYSDCVELLNHMEHAYVELSPADYMWIIHYLLSYPWESNNDGQKVFLSSLVHKSSVIIGEAGIQNNVLLRLSNIVGNLASVIKDSDIEYLTSGYKSVYPINKSFRPHLEGYLSGYWKDKLSHDKSELFIYRPDLLTKEELLKFSVDSYIITDNYELYLAYRGYLTGVDTVPVLPDRNMLGVVGYNIKLSNITNNAGSLPENIHL